MVKYYSTIQVTDSTKQELIRIAALLTLKEKQHVSQERALQKIMKFYEENGGLEDTTQSNEQLWANYSEQNQGFEL